MIAIIFLCVMKSHLFAMFVWNFTTTSLSVAEILLFIKRWSKIAISIATLPISKNPWRQTLEEATDRGMVRLASQHHLCGSESVANSSGSLRACWWRALWTSVVTATATVWTDMCWKLAFWVLVLKDKKISQHRKCSSLKFYTQCLNEC